MIILMPMGGEGTRFSAAGYKINKASIPTTDRKTGNKLPMVVCALKDIPGVSDPENKLICVGRDFHAANGVEDLIRSYFKQAIFIHDHVLLDQAFGCFLAREYLISNEELFIGACDNGFEMDYEAFAKAKESADAIMISHTNDENIRRNPKAHSWAKLEPGTNKLLSISLKETVSANPLRDHATTGMFWFKNASKFLEYLEMMIWKKDTLHGKYYIDKVLQYFIEDGMTVKCFDVKYLCWGTPDDYENYENTLSYWRRFVNCK